MTVTLDKTTSTDTRRGENPLKLKKVHHVELWAGNAKQSAYRQWMARVGEGVEPLDEHGPARELARADGPDHEPVSDPPPRGVRAPEDRRVVRSDGTTVRVPLR